ncbi:MAG: hypothetical protein NT118_08305 [Lentisphaerae bacterium]|nr:hypothetical protein [Lentisphaerota bacterium]
MIYRFFIFGLCLMLCGCGEDAPPSKSNSYTPPEFKKNETVSDVPQSTTAEVEPFQVALPIDTGAHVKNMENTEQSLSTEVIEAPVPVINHYDTRATHPTVILVDKGSSAPPEFTDKELNFASIVNIRNKDVVNEHSMGVSHLGKVQLISRSTPRPHLNNLEKIWDTSAFLEKAIPVNDFLDIKLVPNVIADYKLAEYCSDLKVLNSMIGKTVTVTGMVIQVNHTEKGPKLQMFKNRILFFPKDKNDAAFNNISNFYETGINVKERKVDRYINFLIKVTVRGTLQTGTRINAVDIVNCEVLSWYGVEVLIGVGSTELESIGNNEPWSNKRIRYPAPNGRLRFKIVAGFSSPITYYRYQEKDRELFGFVFQSDETFEGVLIKLNSDPRKYMMTKDLITMGSDPLCLGGELHRINDILRAKGYANKFFLKVAVNEIGENRYKNGNVIEWVCTDKEVDLYPISIINYISANALLTADNGFPIDRATNKPDEE